MPLTIRENGFPTELHDRTLFELESDELAVSIAVEVIGTALQVAWFGRLLLRYHENGLEKSVPPALRICNRPRLEALNFLRQKNAPRTALSSSALFGISQFYLGLEEALEDRSSRDLAERPHGVGRLDGAAPKHWRSVARTGVRLLDELKHCIGHLLPGSIGNMLNAVATELVLIRDADGPSIRTTAPLVDTYGNRRRAKRVSCNIKALLSVAGESRNVVIVDISTGGLGMIDVAHLRQGARATVWLRTRRELAGTISWVSGGRGGMVFDKPLPVQDDLLAG